MKKLSRRFFLKGAAATAVAIPGIVAAKPAAPSIEVLTEPMPCVGMSAAHDEYAVGTIWEDSTKNTDIEQRMSHKIMINGVPYWMPLG